ncbi:EamA family transporter [Thiothrix nivea]|uniref:EamA family transporter n=1 Tax=Thiothrix nivea TaxID=1031 RepID=UPI000594721A|nr:EamA family transporter [Thiothrix nivea]
MTNFTAIHHVCNAGENKTLKRILSLFIFLGLGVISTAIPTLGFAIVSKKLPAIITSMISLFIPLFSAIFAYLILKEELSIIFFIGCTFVLGGVAIIMNKRQIIKKV